MEPKAFISYSWTSDSHRERVRNWADRLLSDGVGVILDQYDLKEGHDKYAFMEKMVVDPTVTHVLVVCDESYATKADARKAGVGTESQIISKEVYDKIDQSKFIPLLCAFSESGEPILPVFVKTRIGINFSSEDKVNANWEQLIRLLHGKPLYIKPTVGTSPLYISETGAIPSNPALSRFALLKQAIAQGRNDMAACRNAFLAACFQYVDELRVRSNPNTDKFGERVLEDCKKMVPIRDLITDWILLETSTSEAMGFDELLTETLEQILMLRSRPKEVTQWNDIWYEAHQLFGYELFLYIIAALLKSKAFATIHHVLASNYLRPETEVYDSRGDFVRFDSFYASSSTLYAVLDPPGQRLYSPTAEMLKRQATRSDLPFGAIIEAELLVFLFSIMDANLRWYPQTLYYASYARRLPFFLRAARRKDFANLAIITGVESGDEFRKKITEGIERLKANHWEISFASRTSFWDAANMDKLDTLE